MTGNIAVYLAAIYGIVGIDMKMIPDFENQILEMDLDMKGHFSLISFLILGIRAYKNPYVKKYFLD